VSLSKASSLRDVAFAVGASLGAHGISAVLTGGACASLHSQGAYSSLDLDFVLTSTVTQASLDEAMAAVGFTRDGDRFLHPAVDFWVEFPRGPLAVGGDYKIRPATLEDDAGPLQVLSPTDACRDRLAAFYHWNDRQSLQVAIQIALRNPVDVPTIRRWSRREDSDTKFNSFLERLERARSR
jgi:hypothetical protein